MDKEEISKKCKWEKVCIEFMDTFEIITERLQVDGGWLYRVLFAPHGYEGGQKIPEQVKMTTTFAPERITERGKS